MNCHIVEWLMDSWWAWVVEHDAVLELLPAH